MRQTCALLLDAYRELNAKKLFWITLVLSMLIVLVIAAIGIDKQGYSIFGWSPEPFQNPSFAQMPDEVLDEIRSDFYQQVFNLVGITIWLTWAAIILAIFSTASIFPDLMTTGAIDTLLTKPITRLRLFLTKYFLGLGFVALQVGVFSVCAFFVVGIRASDWEPKLFLAIPIVLLFFSYLYAVCVLVGVLTRSTLLAVIVTGLVWVGMFAINFTDDILLSMQADSLVRGDIAQQRLDYLETLPTYEEYQKNLSGDAQQGDDDEPVDEAAVGPAPNFDFYGDLETREGYEATWGDEESLRFEVERTGKLSEGMAKWRGYAFWIKTPLPKTAETRALMSRVLVDQEDLDAVTFDPAGSQEDFYDPFSGVQAKLAQKKTLELMREQRGWLWIVLTSILFEIAVVGFAAWRFCRRDY